MFCNLMVLMCDIIVKLSDSYPLRVAPAMPTKTKIATNFR